MIVRDWMKPASLVLGAVLLAWAGWAANGWRLTATHAREMDALRQQARDDLDAAVRDRDVLADRLRQQDDAAVTALRKAKDENASLLDRVNAGSVRLRVAARCPNVVHVPTAASSPGVDPGDGAELDPAARPTYRALRDGIERAQVKLAACQSQLRARVPHSDTSE